MATICKAQCLLPCYSHILFSSQTRQHWLSKTSFENSRRKHLRKCVCLVKKSRPSNRKVKSDAELCNELREFVLAVGLPEGHVPSFKELSVYGRTDLANIVRRRGYKVIRDLLSSSSQADVDESIEEEQQTTVPVGQCQNEKVTDIPIGTLLLSEVPVIIAGDDEARQGKEADIFENTEVSVAKLHIDSEDTDLEHESGDDEQKDEKAEAVLVDSSLLTDFSMTQVLSSNVDTDLQHNYNDERLKDDKVDSSSLDVEHNFDDHSAATLESAFHAVQFQEEDVLNEENELEIYPVVEDSTFSTGTTSGRIEQEDEEVKGANFGESSSILMESLDNSLDLEEKVTKFIQTGHLDAIEDDDTSNQSKSEEINGSNELENIIELRASTPNEEGHGHVASGSSATVTLNGNVSTSSQAKAPTVDHPYGNDYLPSDYLSRTTLDNNPDATTRQTEIQVEINRLKVMLHQKELELSQLKDQVEREKRALIELQKKAEDDINKFQRLISKKTAELQAAEKRLSGLVEVLVQYSGEGKIVEISGSFNGWHHRIKLDPEPSSSIRDSTISRKPHLWSTKLWLYPGVYEIKFIVDGHWTLDPLKETVHMGGITNNILRVVR